MEEIKLWSVESSDSNKLTAIPIDSMVQLEAEDQLEDLIVRSPHILMPNLKLVGRQNPTVTGFLDLLGIDEDGRLVVFELKRGTLTREAVAQIVDYASWLSEMTPESLAQHISERSGAGGIDKIEDFDRWYQEVFPNSPNGYAGPLRMVLVGLGADERTQRMTSYLVQSGVNISLITFYAFRREGEVLLAKHINVEAPVVETGGQNRYTKTSNLEALRKVAESCGVVPLFESVALFFRNIPPAYEWPSKSGYSYSLMERTEQGTPSYRAYISIYVNERKPKQLQVVFWERAIDAAPQAFADLQNKSSIKFLEKSGNLETWVKSSSEWEGLRELLQPVIDSMVEGWKTKSQEV